MSVQFGRWNFDGKPVDPNYLNKVKSVVAPYGPDEGGFYTKSGFSTLYCAFHTSKEARHKMQPRLSTDGTVVTWDGRLDNRSDLIRELSDIVSLAAADVEIVVAAYERWGTDCLARLIGDWALVIWNPSKRSLILAKDFAGIRPLFYAIDDQGVTWSTILDPLVLFAGKSFALCEEYIAGWLSSFPAAHVTPFVGIRAVPPSSFVLLCPEKQAVKKYWDFDPDKKIRYHTDAEYEEHFRTVFADAVRRRLRSDTPVLAELSGGMDSSSIVCVADAIIAQGSPASPRLDTVSYYNDAEPNWNERPYFARVEEKRGRIGCHIDVSGQESFTMELDAEHFAAIPSSVRRPNMAAEQFAACVVSGRCRVLLSGIGGDEIMGGVPTPMPELADLVARGQLRTLIHQLKAWALNKRKPWFHLLFETLRGFLPAALVAVPTHLQPVPWLRPEFVKRNYGAICSCRSRLRLFGALPSFQQNMTALEALRRQLGCTVLPAEPPYEKRYPYLDRDLLEFIYAIPREQLVRPGQRRSLMRRALVGTVPEELLARKRKAFVIRTPMAAIAADRNGMAARTQHMLSGDLGIVDPRAFRNALQHGGRGLEIPVVSVTRTLDAELWLRSLTLTDKFCFTPVSRFTRDMGGPPEEVISALNNSEKLSAERYFTERR